MLLPELVWLSSERQLLAGPSPVIYIMTTFLVSLGPYPSARPTVIFVDVNEIFVDINEIFVDINENFEIFTRQNFTLRA